MCKKMKVVSNVLLEFSCSNYKSIKDEVFYSAIAGTDTTFEETLGVYGNYRILPSTVIYGANGSGKSNFINALSYLKRLVCNSISYQPGQDILQSRHKLSANDAPSGYRIQFVKDKIRYVYGISIYKNIVEEEYLYFFPNGRQVKVFERSRMDVKFGDKYKKSYFENSMQALKDNRLFLSCAANFSNITETEAAFLFFKEDLVFYAPNANNWIEYSIELMEEDKQAKDLFVDMLAALGTGIKDVKVKLEQVKINELPLDDSIPDALRDFLASRDTTRIEAKVIYDQFETDLMTEESTGIKKLFEMLCPIIDILVKGKVLICDEIEKSLHESIVYQIVKLFCNTGLENFAQLIFTTHDTSLLDADLFRRDQVWFTELNEQRATDLYSLVELRNVRKTENMKKGYLAGKYGAIPLKNENFFKTFMSND
ncbi:MAG: ATP-binding protein [Clostridium sp.]|nr:ATP-binding protein [Clostridium sp.]